MGVFKRILVAFKKIKLWKKIAIISIAFFLLWYAFALPRTLFEAPYSTQVTDRNGELLGARIATDGQWRFAPTDSVAEKYKICLIEFEDRWFSYHPGVNPVSIVRALSQNMKSKRVISGGSTITMQTIRLMRQNERTYFEKLIEVILATRLELSYSKNEILAMYASHAPMGGNVVGIDAAAWRYFGHDASNLSW
ncbi:MAG: penicillin-binding protein 1C, partial [Proteiniphilum sp.]|nr:penicillin-binding protein 1C [Proteiniphilum sp.]